MTDNKQANRRFICPFSHYSCPSRFANKNEWKRHVSSQHLQLGFFRCDIGDCNPSPPHHDSNNKSSPTPSKIVYNDFNRKDLFTQHLRRMHSPWRNATSTSTSPSSSPSSGTKQPTTSQKQAFESTLEPIRQRCYMKKRDPPFRSVCGFCSRVFEGKGSWEERMEHVGRHLEMKSTASASKMADAVSSSGCSSSSSYSSYSSSDGDAKARPKKAKAYVKKEEQDADFDPDVGIKHEQNQEDQLNDEIEVEGEEEEEEEEEDDDLREWALNEGIIRPVTTEHGPEKATRAGRKGGRGGGGGGGGNGKGGWILC